MISHTRDTLCGRTCCVCVVGTGARVYTCTCNVKASPPPCTQIYGAEVWRRNSEQGEGGDWSEESGTRVREEEKQRRYVAEFRERMHDRGIILARWTI